ncbi:HNH endonuclease [Nocardia salmonicida]|uniref:HNH endonuclease n=1 Tax=Nocardia salmonicida TaxID=53431 RepID=UPI003792AAD9
MPCWLCGLGIDLELPYTHPMSFTADHVIPRSKGGHLLGALRSAHRRCNSSRGNKVSVAAAPIPTTRNWL